MISDSGLAWEQPGQWWCGEHGSASTGRVVLINDNYYCETCLMSAILDGKVSISGRGEGDNCGHTDEYMACRDCAESDFDLHGDDSCNHDYCHDDCASSECEVCYRSFDYAYCDEHMSERFGCTECGTTDLTVRLCDEHENLAPVKAYAAEPFEVDGNTFKSDDMVVNWQEG